MSIQGEKLQVKVTIKRDDTNALVFCKHDGGRFDRDTTIKMKVQTPYKILLTFKPAQKVSSASLKGEEIEMVSEEMSEELSRYVFQWNSNNIAVSKKNHRLNYPLIVELRGLGVLEVIMQLKFYKADDTGHSAWGKCLHHIDCECIHKEGSSFVEVLKQVYR
ncbi:hypothetical protein JTE90_016492 [Oedothorax gibbosus]|uniref:CB1 cannabinoid receptor-interacting protein 1 n=1 Tax=Oedothorax gibbosus TaxID=931172 RepID=A0AAV6U9N9_9ARAC|nr:hypothetical protein JTE90_016492 [Oedothorax gibbosus]